MSNKAISTLYVPAPLSERPIFSITENDSLVFLIEVWSSLTPLNIP
jgi:hypothetical protein